MAIEVIANIYPAKDKVDLVREGLQELAKHVSDEEKSCLRYQLYEQQDPKNDNAPQFIVVEEYADQAAYDAHSSSEALQALGARAHKENLLSAPLDIKVVKQIGGFASR